VETGDEKGDEMSELMMLEPAAARAGATRIGVPSGLSGYFLATRLETHDARVVCDDGAWAVELPEAVPATELAAVVRRWLRDEALPGVVVDGGGASYCVTRER
jgi:hypothetical protein